MSNKHRVIASIFTSLSLFISAGAYASGRDLQLGSVAMDIPVEMINRLTPLTTYLSKQIGIPVNFHPSPNLNSAVEDLGSNTTQIAYLTPAAYLEAHEKYGATALVSPLNKGQATFTLMIVVPNDSPIQNVADLRGKKFAFGDKKAILQPAVVESAGVKLNEFASYDYLNHYDNIAKAVLNGDFDAGILKDAIAESFANKGLRVIYTSAPLPSYVFAVGKNLPAITVNKLKKAMLALKADNAAHKTILSALEKGYDGFAIANDKDFDGIRKLLERSQAQK